MSVAGSFALPPFGASKSLASLVGMLIGLGLALVAVYWKNWAALAPACKMFSTKSTWHMMALVLGIIVFSAALTCPLPGNPAATLVTTMRDEFVRVGIPLLLVIALIPFISGAVTGVAFGFVGASFPIVFCAPGRFTAAQRGVRRHHIRLRVRLLRHHPVAGTHLFRGDQRILQDANVPFISLYFRACARRAVCVFDYVVRILLFPEVGLCPVHAFGKVLPFALSNVEGERPVPA